MKLRAWLLMPVLLSLVSCGGGDGSGANPGGNPGPSPTPTPTPTPTSTPTPTPTSWAISYLHVFGTYEGDGEQPAHKLLQANDGNFYGATLSGGKQNCGAFRDRPCGTAYRVTPDGKETVIYSFNSVADDGYDPSGGLIQGSDGLLYGVTSSGGKAGGGGVVYRMALDGSSYEILHHFGVEKGDGYTPHGELVEEGDGYFYGTTANGGTNVCPQIPSSTPNCGTVFKVSPDGDYQSLYAFGAFAGDGVQPNGGLLLADDGNFYGTTSMGGEHACAQANDCGAFFRMTPEGKVTILYSFGASLEYPISPNGGLIQARDGYIYGTSVSGGAGRCGNSYGCGTVYRLSLKGAFTKIYSFSMDNQQDGSGPLSLIQGDDGAFYGVTLSGGKKGAGLAGTAFRITPDGQKTTLHSFGPVNELPHEPLGPLIQARDDAFYGVTRSNGNYGAIGAYGGSGTLFRLAREQSQD